MKCEGKHFSRAESIYKPITLREYRYIDTRETPESVKNLFFRLKINSDSFKGILTELILNKKQLNSRSQLIFRVSCTKAFYRYGDDRNERQ